MLLPHAPGFVREGYPTADYARYLGRIAERSAGIVGLGGASVHETSWVHAGEVRLFEDDIVPALKPLADAVHAAGSLFVCQLSHLGREARSFRPMFPLWAPSAISSPRTAEVPVEISEEMIDDLRRSYLRAAGNALSAGADGIEVQAAHAFLINEFLSPWSNHRADSYGGRIEGRMRLLQEILDDIRRLLNPSIIGLRVPAGERMAGGVTWDEIVGVVQALAHKKLIDYVLVSVPSQPGRHMKDGAFGAGEMRSYTRVLKQNVTVPVIISQRIDTPDLAEEILCDGDADVVGLARALIADPSWGEKARLGRPKVIRPCINCMQDCRRGSAQGPIGCAVNPSFARWDETSDVSMPSTSTVVVVVGGGPAGCEAALAAARDGAKVVLFETALRAGGRARLAGAAPHRDAWRKYADYLGATIAAERRIDARFGIEATGTRITKENPAVVILATGAAPVRALATDGIPWLSPDELLSVGANSAWSHVVVADDMGGWEAASAVEALVAAGVKVTYVTPLERVAHRIPEESRADLIERFASAAVRSFVSASLSWRDAIAVVTMSMSMTSVTLDTASALIRSGPLAAKQDLRSELRGGYRVIVIGDALAPRGLSTATHEGWGIRELLTASASRKGLENRT